MNIYYIIGGMLCLGMLRQWYASSYIRLDQQIIECLCLTSLQLTGCFGHCGNFATGYCPSRPTKNCIFLLGKSPIKTCSEGL